MAKKASFLAGAGLCWLWVSPVAAAEGSAIGAGEAAPVAVMGIASASRASHEREGTAQTADVTSQTAGNSDWRFSAAPYFWMASLKGDMGVSEEVEPVGIDLSFFDILGALKFVLMGAAEARKGRFVATGDILYLSMGADKNIDIREVDFVDAELDTKTLIATATAGYRAVDEDRLFVDVFAGGRVNAMKTSLSLQGPRRSFSGSKTETWVDPLIGTRVQTPLGRNWLFQAYGDLGGFGVGSHLTWQVSGAIQYQLDNRWSLSGGWRHLKIDYEKNGFLFDAAMDGPILGAVYRF